VAERLLLVGMMGAGKSTVARLAAKKLGWSWVDTDDVVARAGDASVAELFGRHGEAHFRREEKCALESVLQRDDRLVISVGGGAVLDPINRATLRSGGTVVWLRARPETLMERVRDGAGRPLLTGDSPARRAQTLQDLDAERRPLYAEVADVTVDVDALDAPTVADRVIEAVGLDAPGRQERP